MLHSNTSSHLYGFTDLKSLNERGPLVISYGKGIHVYDNKGNKYLDANSGLWNACAGFDHPGSIEVAKKLEEKKVRVISMPCWEIFNEQPDEYKKELIPDRGSLKVSIEAGITNGWEKYIGSNGLAIGINHFGMSAPANDLAIEFGFTSEQIRNKIEKYLKELL